MFTVESGEHLRKLQVVAWFCVVSIVVIGTAWVAFLANGVSLPGPDLPGFHASASGDDQRSVTPDRPPTDDEHPAAEVSPTAGRASTTPTPKPSETPSATPTPTPTAEPTKDPKPTQSRPTREPGTPPTSPPGKEKD